MKKINSGEIERQVITVLLHEPQLLDTVNINTEWFVDHNYRSVVEAISKLDAEHRSLLNIWGKASYLNPQFGLSFEELNALDRLFVTGHTLPQIVSELRKQSLNRKVGEAASEYQRLPVQDNAEALYESLNNLINSEGSAVDGSLDDAMDQLSYRLNHQVEKGIKTFDQLDDIVGGGLYGSMLFTIGARPSVGKTAFSVNLAYEALQQDSELEVDYFTLEMGKDEMLNRFISRHTGIMSQSLRDPASSLSDIQKSVVRQAIQWLKDHKLKVYDTTPMLDQIVQMIKKNAAKCKSNKYLAIVDYIGLISVAGIDEQRPKLEKVTRELKMLTNDLHIPILALAQLSRGIESRNDKTPQLSDLRDSGSIEQDSNVVAFLHKPYRDNVSAEQLLIQKNREGSLGKIDFYFDGAEMLFKEIKHT